MSFSDLIALLNEAAPKAEPRELADACWLAAQGFFAAREPKPEVPELQPPGSRSDALKEPKLPSDVEIEDEEDGGSDPDEPDTGDAIDLRVPDVADEIYGATREGLGVRAPSARALPGARALLRSLRPLRRRVLSRIAHVIDEQATADAVAEGLVWSPVLRPELTRWLELALLIDDSPSMAVWQRTLREARSLLVQLAAFRDVRVWRMDTSDPSRVGIRSTTASGSHKPGELTSADGSRVILLASDCVAPAWQSGAVASLISQWGARQPVAILQMLPQQLWRRTTLDPARGVINVYVGAKEAGVRNTRLQRREWRAPAGSPAPQGTPAPVLTAEPELLGEWARLIRRGGPPRVPAVIFPTSSALVPLSDAIDTRPDTSKPLDLIERFRASSSPMAFRLMRLLAAAPLSLPVMRLVQHTMLPRSRQVHLAECFLSGLLKRLDPGASAASRSSFQYEFVPGVREKLLDSSVMDESLDVLRTVSRYVESRLGRSLDFDAILASPDETKDDSIGAVDPVFARISAQVLKRLGGRYAEVAARLMGRVRDPKPQPVDLPRERPLAGARVLWFSDRSPHDSIEGADLKFAGAEITWARSIEAAMVSHGNIDFIVSSGAVHGQPYGGFDLLDLLHARRSFGPLFAFHAGNAAEIAMQAEDRHAIACSADFREVQRSLEKAFARLREGPRQVPDHLPDRLRAALQQCLVDIGIPGILPSDTTQAGSLAPDAEDRWRKTFERNAGRNNLWMRCLEAAAGTDQVQYISGKRASALAKHLRGQVERILMGQGGDLVISQTYSQPKGSIERPDAKTGSSLVIATRSVEGSKRDTNCIVIQSPFPYTFGTRHIEWLALFARAIHGLPGARDERPLSAASFASELESRLAQMPAQMRALHCLRLTWRLLDLAWRDPRRRGQGRAARDARAVAEVVEALLIAPLVDDEMRALRERIEATATGNDIEPSNPHQACALLIATYALSNMSPQASSALFRRMAHLLDAADCTRLLQAFSKDQRRFEGSGQVPESAGRAFGGLHTADEERNPPFFGNRPDTFVMVAGSAQMPRDSGDVIWDTAQLLGHMLAAAGIGLVTAGWGGVEEVVAKAYVRRLSAWGVDIKLWLQQITDRDSRGTILDAPPHVHDSTFDAARARFQRADAVVLIRGKRGTQHAGEIALRSHTPLFPLAATGGVAEDQHRQLLSKRFRPKLPNQGEIVEVTEGSPLVACALIPSLVRRIKTNQRMHTMGRPVTRPLNPLSIVAITSLASQDIPVGFVLAEPQLIVVPLPYDSRQPRRGQPVSITDSVGHKHKSRVRFVLDETPVRLVAIDVPKALRGEGLECRPYAPAFDEALIALGPPPDEITFSSVVRARKRRTFSLGSGPGQRISLYGLDSSGTQLTTGMTILAPTNHMCGFVVSGKLLEAVGPSIGELSEFYLLPVSAWYRTIVVAEAAEQVYLQPGMTPEV